MDRLISIGKAARLLGTDVETLRRWDRSGKFVCKRTKGGHRRYLLSDIEEFQGKELQEDKDFIVAVYTRVSSSEQKTKGDLERQKLRLLEYCSEKKYRADYVFEEVGSGMSGIRSKLKTLFKIVSEGKVSRVIIEHKNRLTRFNFPVFVEFFNSHGVEIEWVEDVLPNSFEAELVEDMMSLISSFSSRVYGRRSAERRKKKKEQDENSESI